MVESQTTIRVRDLEHNIQEISSDLMARKAADAEKKSTERKKKKYLEYSFLKPLRIPFKTVSTY